MEGSTPPSVHRSGMRSCQRRARRRHLAASSLVASHQHPPRPQNPGLLLKHCQRQDSLHTLSHTCYQTGMAELELNSLLPDTTQKTLTLKTQNSFASSGTSNPFSQHGNGRYPGGTAHGLERARAVRQALGRGGELKGGRTREPNFPRLKPGALWSPLGNQQLPYQEASGPNFNLYLKKSLNSHHLGLPMPQEGLRKKGG